MALLPDASWHRARHGRAWLNTSGVDHAGTPMMPARRGLSAPSFAHRKGISLAARHWHPDNAARGVPPSCRRGDQRCEGMLKLEQIKPNGAIAGIDPGQVVRVVTTEPAGNDALTVYYKTADGRLLERMLFRTDEARLSVADVGRPWAFDAPGSDFKMATEAYRISLAYLFDPMMAVHASNVDPLPHQITAVYESMLPRQPLRYVLADDPGAGKTIMAGLLTRELLLRADARRVLIVSPGGLVEQWREEMYDKFGLTFTIMSRDHIEQTTSGNPFEDHELLICRLDQLARNDELQEKLKLTHWDLVVVDEAHKMSASWYGRELKETKRFRLGQLLGSIARHFLLMTATPHNGKEEDFQLFLSLLDSDRFYGKFRDGAHKVDVTDLMRRMVKEGLLKFDGTPLFPERRAYTVNYKLSDVERDLYEAVTKYVTTQMDAADKLEDGKRKGTVGFALTTLQRRLASSPEAIYQSLKRRRAKLKLRIEDERAGRRSLAAETLDFEPPDDPDDLSAEETEEQEEQLVDQATAARTVQELEAEILILADLEQQAKAVVHSQQDRKWEELSSLLQNTPEMRDQEGRQRKLIIFTEHRDTLNYLTDKIRGLIGQADAVEVIHGGVRREDRQRVQTSFRNDPVTRVLVATDAAGEGVNLQNANLMVNYDLPWNPNRLEQRFGRIHRIGQTEVCHLWNLVAVETREGAVMSTDAAPQAANGPSRVCRSTSVDEEVYRFLPTIVVGTLDKAALIGLQQAMRGLVVQSQPCIAQRVPRAGLRRHAEAAALCQGVVRPNFPAPGRTASLAGQPRRCRWPL
jgi:superfamily II DNA or RNA helicase